MSVDAVLASVAKLLAEHPTATAADVLTATEAFEALALDASVEQAAVVYSIAILTSLMTGDLCAARFVWKRVPAAVRGHSKELRSVWGLGKALWTRDYPAYFATSLTGTWHGSISQLVQAVNVSVRAKIMLLSAQAFTEVSSGYLSAQTGLSAADTATACVAAGWTPSSNDGFWIPVPPPVSAMPLVQTDLQRIGLLTSYVLALEQKPLVIPPAPAAAVGGESAGGTK